MLGTLVRSYQGSIARLTAVPFTLADEERADRQKRLDFVRDMSPQQWRHFAEYMGGILFDGDSWDYALQAALARAMAYEDVTPDHQAMLEAAR